MLKAHLYRILSGGPASGMIIPALRVETGVRMGRAPGDAELADALADMKAAGHLSEGVDDMTRDLRVALTLAGRKAAARL